MRLKKEFTELDNFFKKQHGFKRKNKTWYKIENHITELIQFQGSTDIEPNFYLNIGLIFNNFEPFGMDRLVTGYKWDMKFRYNLVITELDPNYKNINPYDINLVHEINSIPENFEYYIFPLLKKISSSEYLLNNMDSDSLIASNYIWILVNREKFKLFLKQIIT